MSKFIFTVCQAGAEDALKKEIAREHPGLKFAFSRPGFVTFKVPEEIEDPGFELDSVFARAYGISLGKTGNPKDLLSAAMGLAKSTKLHLHVFERDQYLPGDEPKGFEVGKLSRKASEKILATTKDFFETEALPKEGDIVMDVVVVEENEWWFGYHEHTARHSPFPGGNPKIALPAEAPSRAYLKFEEAVRWADAPVKAGDTIVEIGSSPGGTSFAMLERGMKVVGVDPGKMDAKVLEHASKNFQHLQENISSVTREQLPKEIHWISLDMNTEPGLSLNAVEKQVEFAKRDLLGIFLTIKLNDWKKAAKIPQMLERVRAMGMTKVRATQLPSNRREFFIIGFTRKALRRE